MELSILCQNIIIPSRDTVPLLLQASRDTVPLLVFQVMIHVDNSPSPGQAEDKVLLFFKRRPDVITPDNLHR